MRTRANSDRNASGFDYNYVPAAALHTILRQPHSEPSLALAPSTCLHDLSGKGNKQGLEHDDLEQEMLPAHREVIHPDPGTREGVTDTGTRRN